MSTSKALHKPVSVAKARSRVANLSRTVKNRPSEAAAEQIAVARRDLAAANLEAYIQTVVSNCPKLTPEQASRLSGLINGATS